MQISPSLCETLSVAGCGTEAGRGLEAGLQPEASAQFFEGCPAGGISPEMEETRTPKTGRDWRIFLTLDLDQILGAGHIQCGESASSSISQSRLVCGRASESGPQCVCMCSIPRIVPSSTSTSLKCYLAIWGLMCVNAILTFRAPNTQAEDRSCPLVPFLFLVRFGWTH